VTQCDLPAAEVAARLGVSTQSLYVWTKHYSKWTTPAPVDIPGLYRTQRKREDDQQAELRRLRAELSE